jgi:hypothetical protein
VKRLVALAVATACAPHRIAATQVPSATTQQLPVCEGRGSILGIVRVDGLRSSAALVTLRGRAHDVAVSDAQGEFTFAFLEPGEYHVRVSTNGELSGSYPVTVACNQVAKLLVPFAGSRSCRRLPNASNMPMPIYCPSGDLR